MVTATRTSLPKDRLQAMPADERAFFLQIGNIINQISLFARLLWFTDNRQSSVTPTEDQIMSAQTHVLARYEAGLLWESWGFIQRNINDKNGTGQKSVSALSPKAIAAKDALQKQFGPGGILKKIRKHVAFHHLLKQSDYEAGFQAALADPAFEDDYNWSFHETEVNWCRFNATSELVTFLAMLQLEGPPNSKTLQLFREETNKASENIMILFMELTRIITRKHFNQPPNRTREQVGGRHWKEVNIPFFFEFDREAPTQSESPVNLKT